MSQKGGSIQPVAIEAVTELTDDQEYRAGESNTGKPRDRLTPKHVSLERKPGQLAGSGCSSGQAGSPSEEQAPSELGQTEDSVADRG